MQKRPLEERVLLELYKDPGQKAKDIAQDLKVSRSSVNSELYGSLASAVSKDGEHRWWPSSFCQQGSASDTHLNACRALVVAAEEKLVRIPWIMNPHVPLDLRLRAPFPPRCRFYFFELKESSSGRPYVNLVVGNSSGSELRTFDRSGDYRPFVVGFSDEDEVFVLWDADIYEWGGGFKYNRFCYVGSETLVQAIARGVSTEERSLKKPKVKEVVVGARYDAFLKGLSCRIQLTRDRITER